MAFKQETLIPLAALFGILTLLCVLGNLLVIVSIIRQKLYSRVYNYYILSLACADCFVSITVFPFSAYQALAPAWNFGLHTCQFFVTCDVLFCTSSILNLTVIAIDRHWAVNYPVTYTTRRRNMVALTLLVLIWLLSVAVALPSTIIYREDMIKTLDTKHLCVLTDHPTYIIVSSSLSFFIPCLIILILYGRIMFFLVKRMRRKIREGKQKSFSSFTTSVANLSLKTDLNMDCASPTFHLQQESDAGETDCLMSPPPLRSPSLPDGGLGTTTPIQLQVQTPTKKFSIMSFRPHFKRDKRANNKPKLRDIRAAKLLGVIIVIFVLCWMPFFVANCLQATAGGINEHVFTAFIWLGFVNSLLNPVLYAGLSVEFRQAFKRTLGEPCPYKCLH